jgi:hypothetical protein
MIICHLENPNNFERKLKSLLDSLIIAEETAATILVSNKWYEHIYEWMRNHDAIKMIKVAGSDFFAIKQMRIELKPIDLYI